MKVKPKSFSIKQWNEDDRPREKLISKGKDALSDAELIAILISSGNKEESAVALAKRMLAVVANNLNTFSKLSIEELKQFKGIGEAKAVSCNALRVLVILFTCHLSQFLTWGFISESFRSSR